MATSNPVSEHCHDDSDQRWREASIAAALAQRDYDDILDLPDADDRAINLLWLKLWKAERARDSLLYEVDAF